jgi:hypothetical protein
MEESLLHQPILGLRKGLFHQVDSSNEMLEEQQMMIEIARSRLLSN